MKSPRLLQKETAKKTPVVMQGETSANPLQQYVTFGANPLPGNNGQTAGARIQMAPKETGLPDQLKAGVEKLSNLSLDDVEVHYNSDKPAQLHALAYAQGTEIHIAPGQQQHLPHQAWHVVQQKQGRVKPGPQMEGDMPVNDNVALEKEADIMGSKSDL